MKVRIINKDEGFSFLINDSFKQVPTQFFKKLGVDEDTLYIFTEDEFTNISMIILDEKLRLPLSLENIEENYNVQNSKNYKSSLIFEVSKIEKTAFIALTPINEKTLVTSIQKDVNLDVPDENNLEILLKIIDSFEVFEPIKKEVNEKKVVEEKTFSKNYKEEMLEKELSFKGVNPKFYLSLRGFGKTLSVIDDEIFFKSKDVFFLEKSKEKLLKIKEIIDQGTIYLKGQSVNERLKDNYLLVLFNKEIYLLDLNQNKAIFYDLIGLFEKAKEIKEEEIPKAFPIKEVVVDNSLDELKHNLERKISEKIQDEEVKKLDFRFKEPLYLPTYALNFLAEDKVFNIIIPLKYEHYIIRNKMAVDFLGDNIIRVFFKKLKKDSFLETTKKWVNDLSNTLKQDFKRRKDSDIYVYEFKDFVYYVREIENYLVAVRENKPFIGKKVLRNIKINNDKLVLEELQKIDNVVDKLKELDIDYSVQEINRNVYLRDRSDILDRFIISVILGRLKEDFLGETSLSKKKQVAKEAIKELKYFKVYDALTKKELKALNNYELAYVNYLEIANTLKWVLDLSAMNFPNEKVHASDLIIFLNDTNHEELYKKIGMQMKDDILNELELITKLDKYYIDSYDEIYDIDVVKARRKALEWTVGSDWDE